MDCDFYGWGSQEFDVILLAGNFFRQNGGNTPPYLSTYLSKEKAINKPRKWLSIRQYLAASRGSSGWMDRMIAHGDL